MSVNTTLLQIQVAELSAKLKQVQQSSDARFTLLTGSACFFMLLGFTLLEAGSLRAQNLSAVMLKQFVVACVVGLMWYLFGHGIAFGVSTTEPNNFIGTAHAALHDVTHDDPTVYSDFFFQYCFCSVACSIVSGAIGERLKFEIYFGYLFLMSGFVYPVAAYAQWSAGGWNSPFNDQSKTSAVGDRPLVGVVDVAGCGPIHALGGITAFVAAWLAGPRKGRFDPKTRASVPMPGHNTAFITMGVIILWFGWYSFNAGGKITNQERQYMIVGRSSTNTCIASAVSGLTVLLFHAGLSGWTQWPLCTALNGVLAGLVAITAGSPVVEPWAAFIIGLVAGFFYMLCAYLVLEVMRVDDPVDAVAVHFGCGQLGLLLTGFFAEPHAMRIMYGDDIPDEYAGVFMGGGGKLLGYQLLTMVFITVWGFAFAGAYFYACDKLFSLRYAPADEAQGLDALRFGGESLDYLSPMQQVEALTKTLTSLKDTLMDGNPAGGAAEGSSGDGQAPKSAAAGTSKDDDDEEDLAFGGASSTAAPIPAAGGGASASNEPVDEFKVEE